jgi:hypothetical protein
MVSSRMKGIAMASAGALFWACPAWPGSFFYRIKLFLLPS